MSVKTLLILISFICFSLSPVHSFAAFPIKEKQQERIQKLYQRVNEASAKHNAAALNPTEPFTENEKAEKEDSGVYGILSLVFGLLGIFPAAIVLGIIGMEKHRKYRELAIAGLVLGIVTLVLLLLLIGFFFIFFGTFL